MIFTFIAAVLAVVLLRTMGFVETMEIEEEVVSQ
jgi:hypothetical protein